MTLRAFVVSGGLLWISSVGLSRDRINPRRRVPFDAATATLEGIRTEIQRLYDMELRELNACHEGPAQWYRFEIVRLERLHFERCYEKPAG